MNVLNKPHDVAIVGGGLQGAAIALELARCGRRVAIVEQDAQIMNRASLRNEGKIHLGLIYAADPTMRTARLQLHGALTFKPLLDRWLGEAADRIQISTPFDYLVARDSVFSVAELSGHYEKLDALYHEWRRADPRLSYLGEDFDRMARRTDDAGPWFAEDKIAARFETGERAVNTDHLAAAVREAVDRHPLISVAARRRCESVARTSGGVRLEGRDPHGPWSLEVEQVVNCAWEDRFRLDAMMDLAAPKGWLHRLKYRLIAQLPDHMDAAPSATIVLGPYGDIVVRGDGTAYLSWYPTGCRGWTHDLAPPADWDAPCRGEPDQNTAESVAGQAIRHLAEWCPAIADASPLYVDAGAIVAYGATDVDDRGSDLHDRTRIGVNGADEYFSVDPGKLTTAPLFAMEAARAILGARAPEADAFCIESLETAVAE